MRLVGLCLSWSSCIWQIYTSETLKQAEGVVSTVRCEGREHALGRGIKRKLDSIHSMHSTLHEDQDGQYCTVLLEVNHIRVVKVFPLSSKSILRRNFRNERREAWILIDKFSNFCSRTHFLSFFVRMFFVTAWWQRESVKHSSLPISIGFRLFTRKKKRTMSSRCSLCH